MGDDAAAATSERAALAIATRVAEADPTNITKRNEAETLKAKLNALSVTKADTP
jgi:hypothetical protein